VVQHANGTHARGSHGGLDAATSQLQLFGECHGEDQIGQLGLRVLLGFGPNPTGADFVQVSFVGF